MTEAAPEMNIPPEEPETAASAADNGAYMAQIAALQTEIADAKDKMLRVMADADNMRKRAERQQIDATKFAVTGFARDLLDVADNLRRAIDAITPEQRTESETLNSFIAGIEATERVMNATLEKHGLRKLAPVAGKSDANVHEAVFQADVPGKDAGEIIQLIEPGYMLHERLLRPAKVGVAVGDPNKPAARSLDESV